MNMAIQGAIYYLIAYFTVTLIGIIHTIFNIYILHMSPMNDSSMGEGYEKTKPFHPIYNLIIFPLSAYCYLNIINATAFSSVALIGIIWALATIVIDIFGWVLIKHPWSLSFKQFFVEYQPWISLIYIIIGLSPIIAFAIKNI